MGVQRAPEATQPRQGAGTADKGRLGPHAGDAPLQTGMASAGGSWFDGAKQADPTDPPLVPPRFSPLTETAISVTTSAPPQSGLLPYQKLLFLESLTWVVGKGDAGEGNPVTGPSQPVAAGGEYLQRGCLLTGPARDRSPPVAPQDRCRLCVGFISSSWCPPKYVDWVNFQEKEITRCWSEF